MSSVRLSNRCLRSSLVAFLGREEIEGRAISIPFNGICRFCNLSDGVLKWAGADIVVGLSHGMLSCSQSSHVSRKEQGNLTCTRVQWSSGMY